MDDGVILLHISDMESSEWKSRDIVSSSAHISPYIYKVSVLSTSYELQYVAAGGVRLIVKEQTFDLGPGSLWVNHPGIRYDYSPLPRYGWWDHRYVVFQGGICRSWDRLGLIPQGPLAIPKGLQAAERLDRLIALSDSPLPVNILTRANLLEALLIDIAGLERPVAEENDLPDGLLEALDYRHDPTPDYAALARRFGMTKRTLFRRFKKVTGQTPHAYHLQTKVGWACQLLESQRSIKEVAFQLGYGDVFYFTRQFKQLIGQTPGQYRTANQRTVR